MSSALIISSALQQAKLPRAPSGARQGVGLPDSRTAIIHERDVLGAGGIRHLAIFILGIIKAAETDGSFHRDRKTAEMRK